MEWLDLKDPIPKVNYTVYKPFIWQVKTETLLKKPVFTNEIDFKKVIYNRQSKRVFNKLRQNELSTFLWLSAKTKASEKSKYGFDLEYKHYPSSGAIHPIHILLIKNRKLYKYNSKIHSLELLITNNMLIEKIILKSSKLIDLKNGIFILFVAEPGKSFAKYNNANSLIWRDVGVIIGIMSLVAEYLSLSFCPLGITGEPWISKFCSEDKLFGTGMACLGSI
jgi:SagB-type dehydrogenase family enzyme